MRRTFIILFFGLGLNLFATNPESKYLERAEFLFQKVWNLYRVPELKLFSEYYPNSYKPNLTYFQDNTDKKAREASYLWPMSGVFSSVNILEEIDPVKYRQFQDSMVFAVELYYDSVRTPSGYQAYPIKLDKSDRYYDDNGLVGIDYVDAYESTRNMKYLLKAKEVFHFIKSGWSDDFGGGVSWLEGVRDQKPACSNGKATVLALKLYQATHEIEYLKEGLLFYNWMLSYLEDQNRHIIWNSFLTENAKIDSSLYTYNTGTMIQSSARLYSITGDEKYLLKAKQLAQGSMAYFQKRMTNGVPYIDDLPWFIVVLFRGYQELYQIDHNSEYVDFIIKSADWAWENARDDAGLVYKDWTGRTDERILPKWLLDESCMIELYARIAVVKNEIKNPKTIN